MEQKRRPNLLDRFLNVFTEVHAGEGVSALLLGLNVFILMTAYYIIKPVREALILAGEGGAEWKSYASAGQAILLLGAVPLYSAIASRLPRRSLINRVTIFFAACLGLFYLLAQFHVPLGLLFYLWVGVFNLMIVAQFWAFANDVYTPSSGKRLFVIVAFGQSLGAVTGGVFAARSVGLIGVYPLLLLAGVLLLASLLLTNLVDSRSKQVPSMRHEAVDEPLKKGGAFKMVFQHRYLLLIALLMLFLNWVNTTGEYISVVNLVGLLVQLFIVSRVLKYLGVRVAILVLPLIALGGYFIMAFIPVLSIIRWAKTAENATDYSLQNTVRQVLFLPTNREQKYKAKQAIDTFFVRAGDVLSAVLVAVGTTWLSFQTKHFALFNLGLVVVWLVLAVLIGRENRRLTSSEGTESGATAP
jgi:AAA family ATP:ADP antiporter